MTATAGEFGVDATRHGRILQLAIRNPAQRNAIKPEISAELARQLRLASFDESVGAVVLRGEGEHFCAGGDLLTLGENATTTASIWGSSARSSRKPFTATRPAKASPLFSAGAKPASTPDLPHG